MHEKAPRTEITLGQPEVEADTGSIRMTAPGTVCTVNSSKN